MSSFQALYPVKRRFATRKVGHTGTLDPFATGLLLVLVGKATRLAPWLTGMDKSYEAEVTFGIGTDTLDRTGTKTEEGPIPEADNLEAILPSFLGITEQIPPQYSAVHVEGQRAYQRVRRGETVDLPPRHVTINALHIIQTSVNTYKMDVSCSSGTYIRSLARDIASSLGTVAHLSSLRRTVVGSCHVEDARDIQNLDDAPLVPLTDVLETIPEIDIISVSEGESRHIACGKALRDSLFHGIFEDGIFAVVRENRSFLALVERSSGLWTYRFVADLQKVIRP